MLQKELHTKKNYTAVGEEISHEMAADFITAYDKAYPADTKWFYMGKNILEQILAQPGCAGIRFYNGINEKGQKTLVYIGVDESGNDIVRKVVVEENGKIDTVPAIVADRNDGGISLWEWIFGR